MSRQKSIRSAHSSALIGAVLLASLAGALLAGGSGCGGGGGASNSDSTASTTPLPDTAPESEEARRQAALERLRARQEAACEQVGEALFACAVEDARASMSEEELAKLDTDELRPRYKAEFMSECTASDMSLRQVKVFEGCLQDTACAVFVPCLDAAQPKR